MGKKKTKTNKPSRVAHKEKNLALKHKVSRLKRYIKRMPNDLQAQESLSKLEKKI